MVFLFETGFNDVLKQTHLLASPIDTPTLPQSGGFAMLAGFGFGKAGGWGQTPPVLKFFSANLDSNCTCLNGNCFDEKLLTNLFIFKEVIDKLAQLLCCKEDNFNSEKRRLCNL
eukprot:TRINITY_DN468_c1_g4_i2.p23 TRINITY_DN468_c1_g4~~TRINITY_DN468_c1_g4_i2.p23  ORF type:complete len:114 (+),score=12.17 TRINITY_DN468_c1_g4_i2:8530-8871(+)